MIVNESSGCSPFMRGNNCSQWVSTPPMTWGRPRRPKTHIFMATSHPLTPRTGRTLRRLTWSARFKALQFFSSEGVPHSADLQHRPEENPKVEPEAPVGRVPEV